MTFELWLALVGLFFVGGLTPGPAVLLVMSSSFRYGFWPSMMAALGVASANFIWLALAVSGAAALALALPEVFLILKLLSLTIIFWLGFSIIRAPVDRVLQATTEIPHKGKLYTKGLMLQLSNPLAFATFIGILPLYFNTDQPLVPQFVIMISTLTYLELQGLAVYAAFGRYIRNWLQDEKAARIFNVSVGLIMISAGIVAIILTS